MKRILFVCTGNTCRSPMAEGFARKLAHEGNLDLEFRSAGVSAIDGHDISTYSKQILIENGIFEPYTSHSLTQRLVEWSDLILTMTSAHKRFIVQQYPEVIEKIFTFKEYAEDDPLIKEYIVEIEKLITEMQLKQALGQEIEEADQSRLIELQSLLPDNDIMDPYGQDFQTYEQCAHEIKDYLQKLILKISTD